MKILITGSRGFIGSALGKALTEQGHEICHFDLKDGQNILDAKAVENAMKGKDMVFHLAAIADLNIARERPKETMLINVEGTINVAEACRKYGVFLHFASTCGVYGNRSIPEEGEAAPLTEEASLFPAEMYACSKLAAEYVIRGYHTMYKIPYTILRFATIYGPGMNTSTGLSTFFRQAIAGVPITVHGNGRQTRTLTYIADLLEAILEVVHRNIRNEVIHLSANEEVSALAMAEISKELSLSSSPIIHIDQRPGQTFHERFNTEKAEKLLEWKAMTSFLEGAKRTYGWMAKSN